MMPLNRGWGGLKLAVLGMVLAGTAAFTFAAEPAPPKAKPAIKAPAKPAPKKPAAKKHEPDVRSNSVLVLDAESSAVLFSRKPRVAAPIASITKLMTALVVLEGGQSLDEKIIITPDDRDRVKGSASRLSVGANLTRGDLLHLALMSSDNRAAHAVGRRYPGGVPKMVAAMNAKARALGMKNTRFVDPSGLSEGNVASPEDLSLLVLAASRNPLIRRFSTDHEYSVAVGKRRLEFRNSNTLVARSDWDIQLQKTGYTNEAGRCLVMKTVIDGRPVVIVLLDSFGKYTRVADARRIRRWLEAGTV